jgi:hypothetical protein
MASTAFRIFLFCGHLSFVIKSRQHYIFNVVPLSFKSCHRLSAAQLPPSYQKQTSEKITNGAFIQSQFTCTAAKTTEAPVHCYLLPTTHHHLLRTI